MNQIESNAPNQREKRHAALYFSPKNSKAYKELAARVRSDGGRTTLVWSSRWRGAESILTECRAVVIEKGCVNADAIVEAYRRYAIDVEIHFADADGEFEGSVDEDDLEAIADLEAAASREERDATKEEDEAALAAEVGATHEEEHADQDAATDTAIQEEDSGDGEASVDSDSDGEDAGTEDVGGEEGTEESTDKG
jgi:hypothetical protein